MSAYLSYIPYVLYACPFAVALIVLVRSEIDRRTPAETEDAPEPCITPEDAIMTEVRSRPLYRQYISYGV